MMDLDKLHADDVATAIRGNTEIEDLVVTLFALVPEEHRTRVIEALTVIGHNEVDDEEVAEVKRDMRTSFEDVDPDDSTTW